MIQCHWKSEFFFKRDLYNMQKNYVPKSSGSLYLLSIINYSILYISNSTLNIDSLICSNYLFTCISMLLNLSIFANDLFSLIPSNYCITVLYLIISSSSNPAVAIIISKGINQATNYVSGKFFCSMLLTKSIQILMNRHNILTLRGFYRFVFYS